MKKMIGHQRDILATLGIDIWIPKDVACQNMPFSSIWRDQAPPEYPTEIVVAPVQPVVSIKPPVQKRQEPEPVVIKEVQTEVLSVAVEEHLALQIEPFQLQAFGLSHCVVVVDATNMTTEQQQLWNNIQHTLQAEYFELQWPFPVVNFQEGRGVQTYVQGFLDAMSADKNILLLGQFPYLNHSKSIHLASLQEMLDQPILKKRLWQFMQKKIT